MEIDEIQMENSEMDMKNVFLPTTLFKILSLVSIKCSYGEINKVETSAYIKQPTECLMQLVC